MPVGAGHARENCGRYKYDESWSLTLAVRSKTCGQLPRNVQYGNLLLQCFYRLPRMLTLQALGHQAHPNDSGWRVWQPLSLA
jgi:hypothetical protein